MIGDEGVCWFIVVLFEYGLMVVICEFLMVGFVVVMIIIVLGVLIVFCGGLVIYVSEFKLILVRVDV